MKDAHCVKNKQKKANGELISGWRLCENCHGLLWKRNLKKKNLSGFIKNFNTKTNLPLDSVSMNFLRSPQIFVIHTNSIANN